MARSSSNCYIYSFAVRCSGCRLHRTAKVLCLTGREEKVLNHINPIMLLGQPVDRDSEPPPVGIGSVMLR